MAAKLASQSIVRVCILGGSMAGLVILPGFAKDSHFGSLVFPNAISGEGFTGGTTSLPAMFGNQDKNRNPCLGFGDVLPDYILILDRDVDRLAIQVDSGDRDTTLLVRDLDDGTLYCGDDTELGMDAAVTLSDGEGGNRYGVWVGTQEPGLRWDYTLSLEP
ncbi:MAG: hypothetical protein SWY16_07690 [Cyanobacteriota bacterium]|nr:hypothetical protein [Cyanobacteriota bacterium]